MDVQTLIYSRVATHWVFALFVAMGILLNGCSGCDGFGKKDKSTRLSPSIQTRTEDFVEDPIVGAWVSLATFGEDKDSSKRLLYNFRKDGKVDVRWAFPVTNEVVGEAEFPYEVQGVEIKIGSGEDALTYPFGVSDRTLIMDGIEYVKTDMRYLVPRKDFAPEATSNPAEKRDERSGEQRGKL